MLASLAIAAVGIGLTAAPGVLGYGGPAATLHLVAGPILATIGGVAAWDVARPMRRAAYPIGLLLAAAPLPLAMEPLPAVVSVAAGAAAGLLGALPVRTAERYAGGWSSLLDGKDLP